jgi:hypothetical protein
MVPVRKQKIGTGTGRYLNALIGTDKFIFVLPLWYLNEKV